MDFRPIIHLTGLTDELRMLALRGAACRGYSVCHWPSSWTSLALPLLPGSAAILFPLSSWQEADEVWLRRIQTCHPEVSWIGFSLHDDVRTTVAAMRSGVQCVLEREAPLSDLVSALEQSVGQARSFLSSGWPRRQFAERLQQLTSAEQAVLERVLHGLPNKAVASELHVSLRTIEHRRQMILQKTGVSSVAELVRRVVECRSEIMARLNHSPLARPDVTPLSTGSLLPDGSRISPGSAPQWPDRETERR